MGFEIRVPRAMMPGRLWAAGARPFREWPNGTHRRREAERKHPPPPRDEDVELAVRERLYGTRPHPR